MPLGNTSGFFSSKKTNLMKLKNLMIVWTPESAEVMVVQYPDMHNITQKYECSHGACWHWWDGLPHHERLATFFAICLDMIIQDKVDPKAVRRAMLVVDDVREFVPSDF